MDVGIEQFQWNYCVYSRQTGGFRRLLTLYTKLYKVYKINFWFTLRPDITLLVI